MDKHYVVRGFYNGLDTSSLQLLAKDIGLLMLEKDRNVPPQLPFDPVQMGIFFAITLVVTLVVVR